MESNRGGRGHIDSYSYNRPRNDPSLRRATTPHAPARVPADPSLALDPAPAPPSSPLPAPRAHREGPGQPAASTWHRQPLSAADGHGKLRKQKHVSALFTN